MVRAVIYTDFDGVLNAFPDDKVLRRGGVGHTQWLKEGDPRKELYDSERAFPLTGNEQVRTGHGRFRVHWSRELAGMMHDLALSGSVELNWLTTWHRIVQGCLTPCLVGIRELNGLLSGTTRSLTSGDGPASSRRLCHVSGSNGDSRSRCRFDGNPKGEELCGRRA